MSVLTFTNPLFYYHIHFRVKKPNTEAYLFMSCFSNWINCYHDNGWIISTDTQGVPPDEG